MSWLKFETNTFEKPEVMAITIEMGWEDPDLTVAKLLKVWRWFDEHTEDGHAKGVTSVLFERVIGCPGLCDAMQKAGWMVINEDGIHLPNFARHNGSTAKKRALNAKRKANQRATPPSKPPETKASPKCHAPSVTDVTQESGQVRELEKRREDITSTNVLDGKPPASSLLPADEQKRFVWDVGKRLLTQVDGLSEKQAGSFLGGLIGKSSLAAVDAALKRAERDPPVDVRSWLTANVAGKRKQTSHHGFDSRNYSEGVTADGTFE